MQDKNISVLAVVGGITVCLLVGLAAVLLVAPGGESTQRLALLFGILAIVVPALIGMLRADQAKSQTNGALDGRIQDAVYRAQNVRRSEVEEEICADQKDK